MSRPTTGDTVLDASYVIALLRGHPGAVAMADVLPRSQLLSVTFTEIVTVLARPSVSVATLAPSDLDVSALLVGLQALGVRLVEHPVAAALHVPALLALDAAARARALHAGHAQRPLSLGDRCLLTYALHARLPVLTGDRSWTDLGLDVDVRTYQTDRR